MVQDAVRVPKEAVGTTFNLIAGAGAWFVASYLLTGKLGEQSELREYPTSAILVPSLGAATVSFLLLMYYPIDRSVQKPVRTWIARVASAGRNGVSRWAPFQ